MAQTEAQGQSKRTGSPGRVFSAGSSCVFHLWLSQSIPHGWHSPRLPWQVSAENTVLIISTNNSGQEKCSLGPDLLLAWDFMSEDVKIGGKNGKIWERAGEDSQNFWVPLGVEMPRARLCC